MIPARPTNPGPPPSGTASAYDVAIIGAGVVGCAIARSFAIRGWSTLVVEKAADILEGASKGNSALLHNGFDEPPESLERKVVQAGHHLYRRIHHRMNLPLVETGALVVAWSQEEVASLNGIRDLAIENGIAGATIIGADELAEREPHLSRAARGALVIPGEAIIDPWSAPLAYMRQAILHGATLVTRRRRARDRARSRHHWRLVTAAGEFAAKLVVNAAGLFGDEIEKLRGSQPNFSIRPRKGQFIVFDKPAHDLVNAIILKVPTERTKGVLLARTVFGNLLLGPTAEDQQDRTHAPCEEDGAAPDPRGGRCDPAGSRRRDGLRHVRRIAAGDGAPRHRARRRRSAIVDHGRGHPLHRALGGARPWRMGGRERIAPARRSAGRSAGRRSRLAGHAQSQRFIATALRTARPLAPWCVIANG